MPLARRLTGSRAADQLSADRLEPRAPVAIGPKRPDRDGPDGWLLGPCGSHQVALPARTKSLVPWHPFGQVVESAGPVQPVGNDMPAYLAFRLGVILLAGAVVSLLAGDWISVARAEPASRDRATARWLALADSSAT